MRRLAAAVATLFLCHGAFAVTAQEAQADGRSVGTALSNSIGGNLSTENAKASVPGFTCSN